MTDPFRYSDPPSPAGTDGLEVYDVEPAARPTAQLPPPPTPGLPAPTHRPFNGFLRLKDPIDLAGVWLDQFSLNLLIPLDARTHPDQVAGFRSGLYANVFEAMHQRAAGVVGLEVAAFDDVKVPNEPPRNQIRATLRTARHSQLTTLFRCYSTHSHVYVAIDSFRLGPLNWVSLAIRSLIAVGLFFALLPVVVIGWVAWALVFVLLFGRAIRGIRLYGFDIGLRGAFPRPAVNSSFDNDDCLMYLKALLPTVVKAIRDGADRYGIDISALDSQLYAFEVSYSTTTYNISGSGVTNIGGMINNVVAGMGNQASQTGGTTA